MSEQLRQWRPPPGSRLQPCTYCDTACVPGLAMIEVRTNSTREPICEDCYTVLTAGGTPPSKEG